MRLYTNYILDKFTDAPYGADPPLDRKAVGLNFTIPKVFENSLSVWIDKVCGTLVVRYEKKISNYSWETAYGYISSFFSNCGICYISGLGWNEKKHAPQILDLLVELCSLMGYSQVLYSVNTEQQFIIELLTSKGFKPFEESLTLNKRSDNDIQIYYLNLKGEDE
jgi:hypothetical protein